MKTRPTIIDVARLAGVSKTTVSRVVRGEHDKVSPETQEKVQQAIQELGYEHNAVASSLRTDRTNIVMVSIPDVTNQFWSTVVRGIQDFMEAQGYAVVFANNDWDAQREIEFLKMARRGRFDGILINPIHITERELREVGIPAVILGLRNDFPSFDMVGSDSYNAMLSALEYLHASGHRRIGLLLGISETGSARPRLKAYQDFHRQSGLELEAELIVEVTYDHEGGMRGMSQLLDLPRPPTAVLASNDLIAIGGLHVAVERGVDVPGELSVMGIDDIYAAAITYPPLTSMAKQKHQSGYKAAQLLLLRMRGTSDLPPQRIALPCSLVERGTTASKQAEMHLESRR